jgi:hypothetical protein
MSSGRLVSRKLGGAGAPAALTSITFVDSATSTSSTITIPAAAQAGDVAILFDYAQASSGIPTDIVPTGWTGIITATSAQLRSRISYKILAAGEPGTSVTGLDGDVEDKVMLVFRGNIAATAVSAEDWALECTSANPSSQTVNASTLGTAPLVVLGMAAHTAATAAFSTASPAFDATVLNSDSDIIAGYKIYNSGPADHSVDMNDLGSFNALGSGFLELT